MIRLDMGDEPDALKNEREQRLPEAIDLFNAEGPDSKNFKALFDQGYQIARSVLRARQFEKCAFCEKSEDAFSRPVDHFRPKKCAEDFVSGSWVRVNTHYWWLTWTWTNLYFACDRCNMSGRKGSRFPIIPTGLRLAAPARPAISPLNDEHYATDNEQRLLVDPRVDNPLDHLEWMPLDRTKPKPIWRWTIAGRDPRGDMTCEVFCLEERVDEVNRHLAPLKLLWQNIDEDFLNHQHERARLRWNALLAVYIDDPEQPFRSAAWWALDSLCPQEVREARNLKHPDQPGITIIL